MICKPARLAPALLLAAALLPVQTARAPAPGPVVRVISPPVLQAEPEPVSEPAPPAEVHVIEDCTVTWYTEATCGKAPDHPAYGITASGLPVEEGVTCAVDPAVIPLGSEVCVEYPDGTRERLQATDTGVKGEWVDIYTPSYEYAIQRGLQRLTVYWTATEEEVCDG